MRKVEMFPLCTLIACAVVWKMALIHREGFKWSRVLSARRAVAWRGLRGWSAGKDPRRGWQQDPLPPTLTAPSGPAASSYVNWWPPLASVDLFWKIPLNFSWILCFLTKKIKNISSETPVVNPPVYRAKPLQGSARSGSPFWEGVGPLTPFFPELYSSDSSKGNKTRGPHPGEGCPPFSMLYWGFSSHFPNQPWTSAPLVAPVARWPCAAEQLTCPSRDLAPAAPGCAPVVGTSVAQALGESLFLCTPFAFSRLPPLGPACPCQASLQPRPCQFLLKPVQLIFPMAAAAYT